MAKLVLNNLTNIETSISDINTNSDRIEAAIENTLSRDGTSPNTMEANLDMNSFRITNLPAPQSGTDAARLVDVTEATAGITTIADDQVSVQITGQAATNLGALLDDPVLPTLELTGDLVIKSGTSSDGVLAHSISAGRTWTFPDVTGTVALTSDIIPTTIINAAGDLIYGTANDTPARLGIGAARQVLTTNAGATAPEWSAPITLSNETVSTSGTSIDFTGIPAGVKRVSIHFNGVGTNGTALLRVQLGDSGGIENTGYQSISSTITSSATVGTTSLVTAGIDINFSSAAEVLYGVLVLTLVSAVTNTWIATGNFVEPGAVTYQIIHAGSVKSLTGVLDRVRITTANGTDTFDSGALSISYE